jgi:hypothetical protein
MDRAIVENKDDGFVRAAGARPVDPVEAASESPTYDVQEGSAYNGPHMGMFAVKAQV